MRKQSAVKRAFGEDGALKTHVGGQALIEGVMMRGKYNWAAAVREPNGGIYVEEHDLASGQKKNGWMYWPVVRGCRAFVESLMLGYKALEVAALHAYDEYGATYGNPLSETEKKKLSQKQEDDPMSASSEPSAVLGGGNDAKDALSGADVQSVDCAQECRGQNEEEVSQEQSGEGAFGKTEMAISMVLGLVLGVGLFVVLPAVAANLLVGEYDQHTLAWNLVDGVMRVAIFVFYIWLIGRMKDIKRMFQYHGAEHKTIHCFEHGLPLTPENARSFPRLHVRCGTAFLIMVMIIAIIVYTMTPLNALISAWGVPDGPVKLILVIAVRILLMPVIAGVSYEITVKWAGSHPDNPLVKVILWPGMQMQRLTTHEPDDGQLECAIAAMQQVLEREKADALSS